MDHPKPKSKSPESQDNQPEQSNVSAKPETQHSFDPYKAQVEAAEKTAHKEEPEKPKEKPPDSTDTPKNPENTERDWQAHRKQLVDEKMARHAKISEKIDGLEAQAVEHEKTIS